MREGVNKPSHAQQDQREGNCRCETCMSHWHGLWEGCEHAITCNVSKKRGSEIMLTRMCEHEPSIGTDHTQHAVGPTVGMGV